MVELDGDGEKDLELVCPATPVRYRWFHGDPGRIWQFLTNLVANAIKFTDPGEVAVFYREEPLSGGRTRLRFEVRDSGVGLDADRQIMLFERFSQVDGSSTRKYGGTGLGLAICRQLVQLMDGKIGVESAPGQGSTFWFTLELENASQQPEAREMTDLRSQRVIAVDDNPARRELLRQLLDNWQVEHELAASGDQALRLMRAACERNRRFDIAVIDMQMQGMSGVGLGAEIKKDRRLVETRLVMLGTHGQRGDAEKFRAAGYAGYHCKPIEQSTLYNMMLEAAGINPESYEPSSRFATRMRPRYDARVLLVDDNIVNQKVAKDVLEKLGLTIALAGNGEEALRALRELRYDLVFMDCQMPVMDGYETSRRVRDLRSAAAERLPIVAMTANAMQGDREKCIDAGMDDYVGKPVDTGKAVRILDRCLPRACRIEKVDEDSANRQAQMRADYDKVEIAAGEETVFDHAAFCDRMMGDEELMRTVAEVFLGDMSASIDRIRATVDAGDAAAAAELGHAIKGASANVGGLAMSLAAKRMELAGRAGDLEQARRALPQLERQLHELKSAMQDRLA